MKHVQHRGYLTSGPQVERDTLTCGHCQRVTAIKPGNGFSTAAPFCRTCMTYVCDQCDASEGCTPWEKRLERMEARVRLLKSMGIE